MSTPHAQDTTHTNSLSDPESFWAHQCDQVYWHRKPYKILENTRKHLPIGVTHPHWEWFVDGEISTAYNCVDRHVHLGRGDQTALIWDSPVTGGKEVVSYARLLDEVETLAGVLREEGVRRGDTVLIYTNRKTAPVPMIPAAVFAMLATVRLGAIHAVVFGGFAPKSLAQRIEGCEPKIIMTASCGIEGSKGPLAYQPLVLQAIERSSFKPQKTIVWQRDQLRWDPVRKEAGERNWQRLMKSARGRGVKADARPVDSLDGIYIIYTSGTTGLPKGVLRQAGGHAVGLSLSIKYLFNIQGPGDVMFCASDIGWACVELMRNSSAPLLVGATTVLFEGKPVGTPNAGTFWRIIEEYKVNVLFTAPTALRAIKKDDSENEFFSAVGKRGGLKQFRAIFLAGERSEPSIITNYQQLLTKYAADGARVVDNWWSSESGSPISGIALRPAAGKYYSSSVRDEPLPIRPGSAGKPMPGFDVRVVDDEGNEVKRGTMGNIVMGMPLAPTAFTSLWGDDERFYRGYLKRFNGRWMDTGDAGMIDQDGYIHVMSRSDDIINVAAHRFSTEPSRGVQATAAFFEPSALKDAHAKNYATMLFGVRIMIPQSSGLLILEIVPGAIEQVISSHPAVAESCVVPIPDQLKGHLPFAFVTLSTHPHPIPHIPTSELYAEVQALIRDQIGAIAALGGMIQGKGIIPKTRSGKTLRRVLKQMLEHAVTGDLQTQKIDFPPTIEDGSVVETAKQVVQEYLDQGGREIQTKKKEKPKL
ncbi:MAG: Acyl-CoA synthetase short-chain member 3, mitochondrial [Cirrosporium novae-zelandiae]|nr:MAG: Acyl-CoA synthetase short-chain member 3, mitochondrial [Cirrosporium novae-zelandiae]